MIQLRPYLESFLNCFIRIHREVLFSLQLRKAPQVFTNELKITIIR